MVWNSVKSLNCLRLSKTSPTSTELNTCESTVLFQRRSCHTFPICTTTHYNYSEQGLESPTLNSLGVTVTPSHDLPCSFNVHSFLVGSVPSTTIWTRIENQCEAVSRLCRRATAPRPRPGAAPSSVPLILANSPSRAATRIGACRTRPGLPVRAAVPRAEPFRFRFGSLSVLFQFRIAKTIKHFKDPTFKTRSGGNMTKSMN